jgi:hypothetical protein
MCLLLKQQRDQIILRQNDVFMKGNYLEKVNKPDHKSASMSKEITTYYVLIRGPSYGSLNFEAREAIRTGIREKLEAGGIRFLEYPWVWDEEDRCLLLTGKYERKEDAFWWINALESMGFEVCIRTSLPGEDQTEEDGSSFRKPQKSQ